MPLVLKDRVKETSTTAGTGTLTLGGAPSGYQSFSVIGNGNTTYYAIVDSSANTWEVGIGTYTASGTTLSRDTVLESSSGGSKVSFSSNTKEVFVTYPAELAVSTDLAQPVSNKTITASSLNSSPIGASSASTGAFTTLMATGQTSLGGVTGGEALRATPVASSVNYIQASGSTTGNAPSLAAAGSDTNIGVAYQSKGTGVHRFITSTGDNGVVRAERTAATASYVDMIALSGGTAVRTGGAYHLNFQTNGGTTQAVVTHTASAVNTVVMSGGTTGNSPVMYMDGSDTNISFNMWTKGTGAFNFSTNSSTIARQFSIAHTASAVNYLQVTGAATGAAPVFSVAGSDTNIGMTLRSKGTGEIGFSINGWTQFAVQNVAIAPDYPVAGGGSLQAYIGVAGSNTNVPLLLTSKGLGQVRLMTNTNNSLAFTADFVASAVNYMSAIPAATGGTPSFTSAGSDTNIGAGLRTKGTGSIALQTNSNVTQLQIGHTASAVNYWDFTGSATGNSLAVYASGSDANPGMFFIAKGSGAFNVCTNGTTSNRQFLVAHTASAVNYAQITGGATGNGVTLSAAGSDSNIDLRLTPKGTGVVNINGTAASVSTATCDRTVPVKINGTTLYLMLSTTA